MNRGALLFCLFFAVSAQAAAIPPFAPGQLVIPGLAPDLNTLIGEINTSLAQPQGITVGPWISMQIGPYALLVNSAVDQSATVQAALNACETAGGGQLIFPAGVFYVQGLSRPSQCFLVGMAPKANTGATILRLPANATNYIIADESYVQNLTTATQGGGFQDLTLDGNYTNGTSVGAGGALYIMRAFNSTIDRGNIINSPGHAILFTELSANGSDLPATGSLSNNYVIFSNIKLNSGAAIRAVNSTNNRIADMRIAWNSMGTNGQAGLRGSAFGSFCTLQLDRVAGFIVADNEEFGNNYCSSSLGQGSQFRFIGNYMDASLNQAASGTILANQITAGADGNVTIVGNTFKNIATSLGGASGEVLLNVVDNATGAGGTVVSGNSFESDNISLTSLAVTGTSLATIPVVVGPNSNSANSPPLLWTVGNGGPQIPNCGPNSEGLSYSVKDLNSPAMGSSASGGASAHGRVYCDGTNWTVSAL